MPTPPAPEPDRSTTPPAISDSVATRCPSGSDLPQTTPETPPVPAGSLQCGMEPLPGYRIVKRLGEGGYGQVWEATGPGEVRVALKFVPLAERAGTVELQALQIVKNIRHPNLLFIFGIWPIEGWLIIGMELADETLHDRHLAAVRRDASFMPHPELLRYAREAAKVIDFLNKPRHFIAGPRPVGIAHGDIKPQNILLVSGGVKLGDFGLVRLLEKTAGQRPGGMTPAYAAPEVFDGKPSRWSDQYSLAMTYCFLRVGKLPSRRSPELELTVLPEAERSVVARALAKNPRERWLNCREFVKALMDARSSVPTTSGHRDPYARGETHGPPSASSARPIRRGPSKARGRRLPWLIAACVLLTAGLMGTVNLLYLVRPRSSEEDDRQDVNRQAFNVGAKPPSAPTDAGGPKKNGDGGKEHEADKTVTKENAGLPPPPLTPKIGAKPLPAPTNGGGPKKKGDGGKEHEADKTVTKENAGLPPWRLTPKEKIEDSEPTSRPIEGPGTSSVSDAASDWSRIWSFGAIIGSILLVIVALALIVRNRRKTTARLSEAVVTSAPPLSETATCEPARGEISRPALDSPADVRLSERLDGHTDSVWTVAFSPDGRTVLSGGMDNTVRLWHPRGQMYRLEGHSDGVTSVAFAPDAMQALSGSLDGGVRLWDLRRGKFLGSPQETGGRVLAAAFSAEGRTVLWGGEDRTICFADIHGDQSIRRLLGHDGWITSLAVSSDGQRVISGSEDGTVRLWDVVAACELRRSGGHDGPVRSVAFSPDGRHILSGGNDATMRLLDAVTLNEVRRFEGHADWVHGVAFTPDGTRVVSGSADETVRVWRLTTGEEVDRFEGHTESVLSVACSPDGRWIVSGSDDATIRSWPLSG